MKHTSKTTKSTASKHDRPIPLRPVEPLAAPPARPPFKIDPAAITGTCATGDVLENLLDELHTIVAAAEFLARESDYTLHSLLSMAVVKAEGASRLYDNLDAWKDGAA